VALTVIRDPVTGVNYTAVPGLKAYLLTESGKLSFSFQFAPPVIEYAILEDNYVEVERVGLRPLLVRKAAKLNTIKFTAQIASKTNVFEEQQGYLDSLVAVARSRERVMMRYSVYEAGLWRITSLAISSVVRDPVTNGILQATADITLTIASDPAGGVGPVTAPSNPQPAPAAAATVAPRTYTVAAGDTLWSIANRFYAGRGDRWPVIFDANRDKVTSPELLQPGTVLTIPP
jgi:hypothetical protein